MYFVFYIYQSRNFFRKPGLFVEFFMSIFVLLRLCYSIIFVYFSSFLIERYYAKRKLLFIIFIFNYSLCSEFGQVLNIVTFRDGFSDMLGW